jgi:hypothetical protein
VGALLFMNALTLIVTRNLGEHRVDLSGAMVMVMMMAMMMGMVIVMVIVMVRVVGIGRS